MNTNTTNDIKIWQRFELQFVDDHWKNLSESPQEELVYPIIYGIKTPVKYTI